MPGSRLWTRLWSHPFFCCPVQLRKWPKEEHCQGGNWKEPTAGWSAGPRSSVLEVFARMVKEITRLGRRKNVALGIAAIAGCGVPMARSGWVEQLRNTFGWCLLIVLLTWEVQYRAYALIFKHIKNWPVKEWKYRKQIFCSCTHDWKSELIIHLPLY